MDGSMAKKVIESSSLACLTDNGIFTICIAVGIEMIMCSINVSMGNFMLLLSKHHLDNSTSMKHYLDSRHLLFFHEDKLQSIFASSATSMIETGYYRDIDKSL